MAPALSSCWYPPGPSSSGDPTRSRHHPSPTPTKAVERPKELRHAGPSSLRAAKSSAGNAVRQCRDKQRPNPPASSKAPESVPWASVPCRRVSPREGTVKMWRDPFEIPRPGDPTARAPEHKSVAQGEGHLVRAHTVFNIGRHFGDGEFAWHEVRNDRSGASLASSAKRCTDGKIYAALTCAQLAMQWQDVASKQAGQDACPHEGCYIHVRALHELRIGFEWTPGSTQEAAKQIEGQGHSHRRSDRSPPISPHPSLGASASDAPNHA